MADRTEGLRARSSLSELLRTRRDQLIDEWSERVRSLRPARELPRPALVDAMPDLLDRMADLIDAAASGEAIDLHADAADAHALERLEVGFDVGEVLTEYAALRDTLLRHAAGAPTFGDDVRLLNLAIDRAVDASVRRFTAARDRALDAIDRVATRSLRGTDTELIDRLLRGFLESAAAIDSAIVYVRDGDGLLVRGAAGLGQDRAAGRRIGLGEGVAGRAAARGRACGCSALGADADRLGPLERVPGLRALYAAPMCDGDELVGVVAVGSCTAYELSRQDCQLVSALASRATAGVIQHRLRAALVAQHTRLSGLLEHAPIGLIIAEAPSGQLILGNRRADEIWRKPLVRAATIDDYIDYPAFHPDGRALEPAEWAIARAVAHGETVLDQEVEIVRGDGTRAFILNSAAPLRDDGRVVGAVAGFVDITARRRAEAELREAARTIEAERARYSDLVNNLDDIIVWEADPTARRIGFVSAHPERLTGYRATEWTGDAEFWSRHVPEGDRERLLVTFERARVTGEARCEHRFVTRTGRVIWLHTSVRRADGDRHLQGISVDVTSLREAMRARDEVLSVVSHDLRSPLDALSMNAQLIERAATGELRTRAGRLIGAVKRMTRMLDDLVDLGALDAGLLSIAPRAEDPASLLAEAAAAAEHVVHGGGLTLEIAVAAALPGVLADRDRVLQVFSHLLGNAAAVSAPGGRLVVGAELAGRYVRMWAADSGPGIPRGEHERIFERHRRGSSATYPGSGLGLAIARALVTAMGGRIWVDSEPGAGSTFSFTLPVAVDRPAPPG